MYLDPRLDQYERLVFNQVNFGFDRESIIETIEEIASPVGKATAYCVFMRLGLTALDVLSETVRA